jgi:hypothetical protein
MWWRRICLVVAVGLSPLRGDAAVYYLDLADSAVTQNLNLDLVPGWAPGQPWEFRTSNFGSIQTFLLTNQVGMPEPGNRILAINAPVCPGVVNGFYQDEAIALHGDEIIGPNPMPTSSFTEIGVPYWSGSALLRQGSQLCTGLLGFFREPTQWDQLAPGARRYVGLLLTIEGEIHYGWLGLNVGSLSIDDFAYEDVPDTPIRAGDTVPEPGAGLLGMTAVLSLAASRRCRAN